MEVCEEDEKTCGWGTMKISEIRVLRGCKLSMEELR